MATERDVDCPHCGASRSTKASRATRISCFECGELFPAPQPPASPTEGQVETVASDPAPDPPPAPDPGKTPEPVPAGVQVERATSTTVKQTARPRPVAERPSPATKKAPPKKKQPAKKAAPAAKSNGHKHPQTERARVAGRRGGRAMYGKVVARGRR